MIGFFNISVIPTYISLVSAVIGIFFAISGTPDSLRILSFFLRIRRFRTRQLFLPRARSAQMLLFGDSFEQDGSGDAFHASVLTAALPLRPPDRSP